MTKAEIIETLSREKRLKEAAQNIAGSKGLGDDLYQHLFLVLLEYEETKIIRAHEKDYIFYTCIKIMRQSYNSKSSPFAVVYRQHANDVELCEDLPEINECEEDKTERIESFLSQPITTDNFYQMTLLRRWAQGESYRVLSRKTKIPQRSIEDAIKRGLKKLRQTL